jgi:hypothetical protein
MEFFRGGLALGLPGSEALGPTSMKEIDHLRSRYPE